MKDPSPQERAPVPALLLVLASVLIASTLGHAQAHALHALNKRTLETLAPLALAAAAIAMTATLVRTLCTRRTLRTRVDLELLPSESFDPNLEAVTRFASQLASTRRSVLGWPDRPASAVRLQLTAGADGLVHYRIGAPERALPAIRAALGAYEGIEARLLQSQPAQEGVKGAVARAELVLARRSALPLADVGLKPDPLQSFAAALARIDRSGSAVVAVDVMPAAPYQRRRLRRRLLRQADRDALPLPAWPTQASRPGRMSASESASRRFEGRALERKLGGGEPLLGTQILLRVKARSRPEARARMQALLSCFDAFAGENHLRVAGLNLGGVGFLGSDLPWRRASFDRRIATGRYAPRRRRFLGAGELAGLLKPPTVHCAAENVARSGGVIPPPPPALPTFRAQRDLIPLGRVLDEDGGERLVGVRAGETFFSYMAGRSRYGKTETAIGQFVHLVRSGHGGLFLDPHADAIREIKTYLADVKERVIEIDLSDPDSQRAQPTWNLFSLERRTPGEAAGKVEAFVDALAAALRWDDRNTRALNIATQAGQALVELALRMPAELAPTIFQVPTLLSDSDWRQAALPHMSRGTAGFFRDRFPRLAPDAATAVTNIVDRLRAARPVAALLGEPVSTYDAQRAMRDGMIVLVCPGSGSTRDRLVANLLVYDMLHAFKLRAHLAPKRRKPFWLFLDELQTYDGANLPVLLEQSAKYGGRAFLFNQNPERLSSETWNAVTTNRSHLSATTVNAKASQMIAREWAGQVEADVLTRLARFTYLTQATLGERTSKPFLVHGVTARELHAEHYTPPEDAPAAPTRSGYMSKTLKRVEGHDERIARWLEQHAGREAKSGEDSGTRVLQSGAPRGKGRRK
jgi:hypothetical protein